MLRGLKILVRTVWFAGFLLVMLGGLLAMKMVSATAPDIADRLDDATAALTQIIPGENTLTDSDRSVPAPDTSEAPLLPVESSTVRLAHAEFTPSTTAHKRPRIAKRTTPRAAAAKQSKMTDKTAEIRSCRQLDPIARFLASTNLARPCAG